ncbi:MAG: alkaline phosphatase family protein [Thermaerobacter sp.]|nr:peptidase [Bacillota bacterium]REJ33552.1 MAG: peptidase [Bacillota bacterium]
MKVFLWFVDGLGLGPDDPRVNPLAAGSYPALERLLAGRPVAFAGWRPSPEGPGAAAAVDAALGVPGLPQSATGQTALLTGRNAPAVLGRHVNGYPTPTLVRLLQSGNLFTHAVRAGLRATFLNAFGPGYLQLLARYKEEHGWPSTAEQGAVLAAARDLPVEQVPARLRRRRFRPSVSTVAVDAAGLPLRGPADLERGLAVPHDITGEFFGGWASLTVEEAAEAALRVWDDHDLTFFEFFMTDLAGHSQDRARAEELLARLDRFAGLLLGAMDPRRHLLVLVSDHGNVERLDQRTHTDNPVPFAAWGAGAGDLVAGAAAITDVTPRLLALLGVDSPGDGGDAVPPRRATRGA